MPASISSRVSSFALAAAAFLVMIATASAETPVTQAGDASIVSSGAGTWVIRAGGAALTVEADAGRGFQILSLAAASGQRALAVQTPGASVAVGGAAVASMRTRSTLRFDSAATSSTDRTVRLDASYELDAAGVRVVRHVQAADGSPTFEMWTTLEPDGSSVPLSDVRVLDVTVPASNIHWLTGLTPPDGSGNPDAAFTARQQTLGAGETLTLESSGRSSEQAVPWFAADVGGDEFYAALMWSGPWQLTLTQAGNGLSIAWGLGSMQTSLAGSLDTPHVLFGIAPDGLVGSAAALRTFVLNGIRGGRPLPALVTFNTWYSDGIDIDEQSIREEMTRAAEAGVELFVVDAGWYPAPGAHGPADFDAGLGSWIVDPDRFPSGLQPLRDYAHGLGMRFGLWVDPEQVDRDAFKAVGGDDAWLATSGGDYGSPDTAQICLAGAAGRQWMTSRLTALLDAVQPDYLKWDDNIWVNCDRAGHGHGASDGAFAHVNALYEVLASLRQRYPDMLIENVSGGGHRLDFGMLRYTDVAWMDDHTAPSAHVRHNLEGLSAVFPPAYLLSFVVDSPEEPIDDAPDLPLYARSRMPGVLGFSVRLGDLSPDTLSAIAGQVAAARQLRAAAGDAAGALLSAQTAGAAAIGWDVLQTTAPGGASAVLFAYDNGSAGAPQVALQGLDPAAVYAVVSLDGGDATSATGQQLMTDGLDVDADGSPSDARVFTIVSRP